MITVPLDEQQKVHEYLRRQGKTAHPMVETSNHFTYTQLEKLSQILELPSIDSLLYETTFTEADKQVGADLQPAQARRRVSQDGG